MSKNHYAVLGVTETAEDVVIKAAYKALIQVYHPDKFAGDKQQAEAKTKEINEAYAVLSDPQRRREYDEILKRQGRAYDPSYDNQDRQQNAAADAYLQERWEIARNYVTNLDKLHDELLAISPSLAFTFKLMLLENKQFGEAVKLAKTIEFAYLKLYFGGSQKVQAFAKWLLVNKHREAAKELNSVISVVGSSIDENYMIEKISDKYNLDFYKSSTIGATENSTTKLSQVFLGLFRDLGIITISTIIVLVIFLAIASS